MKVAALTKRDVEADMMHSGSCDFRAKAETVPSLQSDGLDSGVREGLGMLPPHWVYQHWFSVFLLMLNLMIDYVL